MKKAKISIAVLLSLLFILFAMGSGESTTDTTVDQGADTVEVTENKTTTETKDSEPEDTEKTETLGSDFKTAMDSYEAFIDEYVDFMKKYAENPADTALLADYSTYMSKYSGFVEDFEKWDEEEMNDAELAYYLEVQARVNEKLLEIA